MIAAPRKPWDFFISYARQDRQAVANPLTDRLNQLGFTVWLDHKLGIDTADPEDISTQIQTGLKSCHAGVMILSSHYIRKDWPLREFDTLLALEAIDGRRRVVPIRHVLDTEDLDKLTSSQFLTRVVISTSLGIEQVCARILGEVLAANERGQESVDIGAAVFPKFSAPGILRCCNSRCSWAAPQDWPEYLKNSGPEFSLGRVQEQWCIVCAACRHPVGSLTTDEARTLVAKVFVDSLYKHDRH